LLVYLLATVLLGVLLAPPLFWGARSLIAHGSFTFLARYDFETYFHRALLIAALVLLWPLARSLEIRKLDDLQLAPNPRRWRDLIAGILLSAVPLLCCAAILVAMPLFSIRANINWSGVGKVAAAAAFVPIIEETFFRGLVLGALLKTGRQWMSIFLTSVLYSIVHFLKAPDQTSPDVTWVSGFNSIGHAFVQFTDPLLVGAGLTTLFLIGWILAEARLLTRSLWLSIGLHAGWIFWLKSYGFLTEERPGTKQWFWGTGRLLDGWIALFILAIVLASVQRWLEVKRSAEMPRRLTFTH